LYFPEAHCLIFEDYTRGEPENTRQFQDSETGFQSRAPPIQKQVKPACQPRGVRKRPRG